MNTYQDKLIQSSTLSIGILKKAGSFLARVLAVLVIFVIIVEGFARTPLMDQISPYRSLGMWYFPFDVKWHRLEQYARLNQGIDVIILGSSLVNTGFVPEDVAQAYQAKTGKTLRIFNFGVDGMTISPNSRTAQILVEKYHPQLLIFVTEIRDYDASNGLEVEQQFLSEPWVRYKTGQLDVRGWAADNSLALQHYLVYRNWLSTSFAASLRAYQNKLNAVTVSGYEPDFAKPYFKPMEETAGIKMFPLDDSRLTNLKAILDLGQSSTTQIMILEMPVDSRVYLPYGGETAHTEFRNWLSSHLPDGVFLNIDAGLIPDYGRSNEVHLNYKGAPILSAYLGEQLAHLVQQNVYHFSNMP